jgi:RNA polymerase sigma factor (sigma-70 family)
MDKPTDAELIASSLEEPQAFSRLFDRHYDVVRAYLLRRVGPDVAPDLAAEVFTAAFDARRRYDQARPQARPWLLGIATNLLRHHRRTEVRRIRALARLERPVQGDGGLDGANARVDAAHLGGRLLEALATLATGERDVLLLVAWTDLGYAEIAEALHVPVGTVRSRLNRARSRLRERLGRSGQSSDADHFALEVLTDG